MKGSHDYGTERTITRSTYRLSTSTYKHNGTIQIRIRKDTKCTHSTSPITTTGGSMSYEPRLDDDIALGIEFDEEEDDTGEPDRMWGDDQSTNWRLMYSG